MRASLRTRIFIACFAIGSGIAVAFGGLTLTLLELLEYQQIDAVLHDELARFMDAHASDPDAARPNTSFVRTWATAQGDADALPLTLRALRAGPEELLLDGRELRAVAAERGGVRYVLAMDLTLMEPWEDQVVMLVVLLVVVSIVLSALLGLWLSNRVVSPLVDLSARITHDQGEEDLARAQAPLPGEQARDELGQLARALSRYMELLRAHVQREREFSAQASHELRTPVAIAASSLELAQASGELTPRTRTQLARATRAVDWMKETIETLLAMSRAQSSVATGVVPDAALIVRDQLAMAETPSTDGQ